MMTIGMYVQQAAIRVISVQMNCAAAGEADITASPLTSAQNGNLAEVAVQAEPHDMVPVQLMVLLGPVMTLPALLLELSAEI